ncbi:biopolymer transporter Tol, partial [Lysobacter sp. D1-1-M9]|uniref:TolB family protein n=1 Tax=Novilysobacter longmucuonensis TaxID=3098603 RepID=UPI0032042ED5
MFVRNTPVGDFWRIPAGGGQAERITHLSAQIRGWDWSPAGDGLVYSLHRDNTSRLYHWDFARGEATDLGIVDAEDPATVVGMPALAYVHTSTRFGIYRYRLDGKTGGERLFASSGRDRLAALAPDSRRLAFTSDRSGQYRLWWGDLDKPGSLT